MELPNFGSKLIGTSFANLGVKFGFYLLFGQVCALGQARAIAVFIFAPRFHLLSCSAFKLCRQILRKAEGRRQKAEGRNQK
ncbi:MAG: hypothetical protein SW833_05520 [Cyanobacteriota bacterium]|nr:hypothetical protein [Cyanobacteriota bacterium]